MADFGEGFYVMVFISVIWAVIVGLAIAIPNEISKTVAMTATVAWAGAISSWFPTRGQTNQQSP